VVEEQSGESVMAFCRREAVAESAFYRWRSELKQRSAFHPAEGQTNKAARFLPVKVADDNKSEVGEMELHLGTACVIHLKPGFDRQTLMDVLSVLEASTC
jgi:transposase-like protein